VSADDAPRVPLPPPSLDLDLPDAMDLPNGLTLTETFAGLSQIDRVVPKEPESEIQMEPELTEAELALLESVAQAATQGFLTPSGSSFEPLLEVEASETIDPIPQESASILEPNDRPGVGVSTALDDLARLGALVGDAVDTHCLAGDFFMISEWERELFFKLKTS